MSIEAVIAYWEQTGLSEADDVQRIVDHATAAGFAFDAAEFRTAVQVRELLYKVHHDQALRAELRTAQAPMSRLLDTARRSGYQVEQNDILAVFRALRPPEAELNSRQLDQVAGGARTDLPDVGDEVLVAFVNGGTRAPFIVGSLWNGSDKPAS
jgi:hypothetical protein